VTVLATVLLTVRSPRSFPAVLLTTIRLASVRAPWAVWAFVLAIILPLVPYAYVRYRNFSEVYHQEQALALISAGNVSSARAVCQNYLRLYPQRRADGALEDPVCVPLLTFAEQVSTLRDYLVSLEPRPRAINGFDIPLDWNALRFANHLTGAIVGRNALWNQDASGSNVEPLEITLSPLPTYSANSAPQGVEPRPSESIAPKQEQPAALFRVIDVAESDFLNVRDTPGATTRVIGQIPASGRGIVLLGDERTVSGSNWVRIRWMNLVGWVNERFLAEQVPPR